MDLLQDDDENLEIWYLTGVASLSSTPPDLECAKYHFETALQMMEDLMEEQKLEASMSGSTEEVSSFSQNALLASSHRYVFVCFAPSCVFQVVYPFQEQYDLVVDHLKLLSDMRATNPQTTTAESESAEQRIAAAGETMEEEWSTCDEEEDEEI